MSFLSHRMAALALLVPLLAVGTAPAMADTAPLPPVTTATVSADSLPTVQIGPGVVWDQAIVGNTVYVTGEFSTARPAGVAIGGAGEVARSNILAYNLSTGVLSTTWVPTLNALGKAIEASADGKTIYVGGSFTSVSGVARNRIAALDATTGAVITTFNPNANARVNVIDVAGSNVYLGGIFTTVGGQARTRLAAVAATNGAVQAWAPSADAEVMSLTAPPGGDKVVVGGHFNNVNTTPAAGLGAISIATGGTVPFAINSIIRNGGNDAGITSLTSDANNVYGTGYTFGPGNFEGSFSAAAGTGAMNFITGCRGDTYDATPSNGVLYSVSHSHDCSSIGGNPQTDPWTFQHAYASTTTQGAGGATNQGGTFGGQPAPELLHWLPTFTNGTYTGMTQAAWTVESNSQYVVAGGEFPRVNGGAQQGLSRFAVSSIAPDTQGPLDGGANLAPTVISFQPGRVRVSWKSSWDRDNRKLTYEVLRGATLGTSVVVSTQTQDSSWFNRPMMSFQDTAPAGSTQGYRIRVRDAFNNILIGNTTTYTLPDLTGTTSVYADAVLADGASHLWRLGEASGTTAYDYAAVDDLTLDSSAVRGADGAMTNEVTAKSTTFAGGTVPAVGQNPATGPNSFSAEGWFKTTSSTGGKIVGFGDGKTGTSNNYDRHVYMTNAGNIVFGVYNNGVQTLTSPLTYNDGQWHQFTVNLGSTGMDLYLDGKRVARNAGTTIGQPFTGYWRVGGDNLGGWPSRPSSNNFSGGIEDVAIYPAPLTLAQVQNHYQASGRSLNLPARPTDAYGAAVWDANPSLYWRLDDAAGSSTAVNRMTNEPSAGYSAGVVRAQPGAPANPSGSSISLPGTSTQALVATTSANNPSTYSIETWFKTTTTSGGRLIGFGTSATPNGTSSGYDRYIYMLNDGTLRYGIYNNATTTVASPSAYNDGQWHLAVATQGSAGMQLFVDGALVGSNSATGPQSYVGYWRLGSDNTWGGASSDNFAGSLDEAAIYDDVLPAATVGQHYRLGRPASANQAPTAAFTSTKAGLKASFDAAASTDPDGTIASYAWDFGDDETGTGASPEHTYAAAGTYTVGLTVTDDNGATGSVTDTVTVSKPANVLPTAAFTSTCTDLVCAFDGSGSTDSDGTIASYAWTFGDGTTGTGVEPAHTYASAGSRSVTLTVTDNDDAIDATTQTVTVSPANNALAEDTFGRTVASGFGTAETGGAWTTSGAKLTSSVVDGSGRAGVPAGSTGYLRLAGVQNLDTDVTHTVSADAVPTGGGAYLATIVRSTAAGDYFAQVRIQSSGAVALYLSKTGTVLGSTITVPGLTYTAGAQLKVRVQAVGSAPTTLRAKVWPAGGSEPAAWPVSTTDSTAGYQVAGGVGLSLYASGSATAPIAVRYDDLLVTSAD